MRWFKFIPSQTGEDEIDIGIADNNRYFIEMVNGLETVSTDIQTQKSPYQDGVTYIDNLMKPREIEITGRINTQEIDKMYEYRAALIKALNPKYGLGDLIYTYDGGAVQTKALGQVILKNMKWSDMLQGFKIDFFCPDPYFYSTTLHEIALVINDFTSIENLGTGQMPFEVTIYPPFVNMKLSLASYGFLELLDVDMPPASYLYINTKFGERAIEARAEGSGTTLVNYIPLLSAGSEFFLLFPGTNVIRLDMTGTTEFTVAGIFYRDTWIGI